MVAGLIAGLASMLSRWFGAAGLKPLLWIIAAAVPIMAVPVSYGARLLIDFRFGMVSLLSFGEGMIRNGGTLFAGVVGLGREGSGHSDFLFGDLRRRRAAQGGGANADGASRPRPMEAAAGASLLADVKRVAHFGDRLWRQSHYRRHALNGGDRILLLGILDVRPGGVSIGDKSYREFCFPRLPAWAGANVSSPLSSRWFSSSRWRWFRWRACKVLLAQPAVLLLFHQRWLPAAGVVQWLSVGMLTQPLNAAGFAVLMSRGEYKKMFILTAIMAVLALAGALAGSFLGEQDEIAKFTAAAALAGNILPGWAAHRALQGRGRRHWSLALVPVLIGAPAALAGWCIKMMLAHGGGWQEILTVSSVVLALYGSLSVWLCPELWEKLATKLREARRQA